MRAGPRFSLPGLWTSVIAGNGIRFWSSTGLDRHRFRNAFRNRIPPITQTLASSQRRGRVARFNWQHVVETLREADGYHQGASCRRVWCEHVLMGLQHYSKFPATGTHGVEDVEELYLTREQVFLYGRWCSLARSRRLEPSSARHSFSQKSCPYG